MGVAAHRYGNGLVAAIDGAGRSLLSSLRRSYEIVDNGTGFVQSEFMFRNPSISFADVANQSWPDRIDAMLTVFYLTVLFGLPLLGYVAMVIDIRRYLRSLRRALMVVTQVVPFVPYWALMQQPACLRTFGLKLPCSEEELLAAYRELAKSMHPDHGGDLQQFLRLQKHFEEAISLVRIQP